MAACLQGSLLVRFAPPEVADAFCGSRLGTSYDGTYGTLTSPITELRADRGACHACRLTREVATMNDVVPMLTYADGPAAMDWLVRVFGFEGPAAHRVHCSAADAWQATPYVVDGVARLYRTEDLEGHRWMFMQRV